MIDVATTKLTNYTMNVFFILKLVIWLKLVLRYTDASTKLVHMIVSVQYNIPCVAKQSHLTRPDSS